MEEGGNSSNEKHGCARENKGEEEKDNKVGGVLASGSATLKAKVDRLELRAVEEPTHLSRMKVERAVQKFSKLQEQDDDEEEFDDTLEDVDQEKYVNPGWSSGYKFSIPVPVLEDVEERLSYSSDICRICHDSDKDEGLLSPCKCKGSMSLVHRSCLERWLAEADSTVCELCGHVYNTKRSPKYGLLASVWAWLRSSETRRERREMAFDFLACCAFTPLVVIGTYLGIVMGETLYLNELELDNAMDNLPGRLATLSVVSLMTTLDLAYASWLLLKLQYHIGQWYFWYRRNCKVSLLTIDTIPPNPPAEEQHRTDRQMDTNNNNFQPET